ncbi:hypothetical protein K504DRAFT_361211, partial [Pleomassaria siparia CBS 279.74]
AHSARLHKRGNSASSITSPLSPSADAGAFIFNRSETPKVTYEEPWNEPVRPMPAVISMKKEIKIKPYLRKLSSKDHNGLDLSRPAAENESLAGLGISEYGGYSLSISDVNFAPVNGRSRQHHNRTTSNTSQFSTTSSLHRPTAPYMPLIRQSPQPYTPPISKSSPTSVMGNEHETDGIMTDGIMTDDEFRLRLNALDPARRSDSLSSVPGVSPPLRIHTTGSSTRLGGSGSHSAVSLNSPVGASRARGDTHRSIDTTTSPSSRTSFDKAFGFIRGSRDEAVDPASRAASIRAARAAFQEKEEAKERKYGKEASKKAERDIHKQRKISGLHDKKEHRRGRSISDTNEKTPRPSVGGRQYTDHRQAHTRTLPNHVVSVDHEKSSGAVPQVTKSRAAKGRWLRFVAWIRTRLLRLSRR